VRRDALTAARGNATPMGLSGRCAAPGREDSTFVNRPQAAATPSTRRCGQAGFL